MLKTYEVQLDARFKKIFTVNAPSAEEARNMIYNTYVNSDVIDMTDEDVTELYIDAHNDNNSEYCDCHYEIAKDGTTFDSYTLGKSSA